MKEEGMKKKSRKKKVNMNRKKVLIVSVAVVIIAMIGVIIYIVSRGQDVQDSNRIQSIQEVVKNKTEENQNNIQIKNTKIEAEGATIKGTAKIKNKSQTVNNVKVSLVLYDAKNNMRGNNSIIIESLQAGEEKEITIEIIGSYKELKNYQFRIEK